MGSKSEKKHDKSTKNRNSKETKKNKKDIKNDEQNKKAKKKGFWKRHRKLELEQLSHYLAMMTGLCQKMILH